MAAKGNLFMMNLRPKRKTFQGLSQALPLPIKAKAIEARFTGYSVEVTSSDDIRVLCLQGGFGQEEAFFLMHTLNILKLENILKQPMHIPEAFEKFRSIKKHFLACYCAYLYLKSKNWVIKSGIKFGGDFVIYVRGPQFYHASYIVLIQEMFEGKPLNGHTVDGLDFQGFNRIAETTAKDILVLEVHYPKTLDLKDNAACLERLKEVRVAETFTKHHNYLAARHQ